MAKLPAFQFYPGDWMKDPSLSICSLAAQGLLMRLLCLCHESAIRGAMVLPSGVAITNEQLHRACSCGVSFDEFKVLLIELESNGVLKRSESGYLYSQRMVKDEQLRTSKSESGRKGACNRWQNDGKQHGKPMADTMASNMAKNGSSSSSSISSSSSSSEEREESAHQQQQSFQPPLMEEIEFYAQAIGATPAMVESFYDYFCENGWTTTRGPMADWRAAFRRWVRSEKERPHKRGHTNSNGIVEKSSYTPAQPMTEEEAGVPY